MHVVAKRSPVILYHMVANTRLFDSKFHFVTVRNFEAMLHRLKAKYTFVFVDEFFERLQTGKDVSNMACLTFDDGYVETLRNIAPIVHDLKVPATFYLNSSFVEGSLFWRDKIRLLMESGKVEEFLKNIKLPADIAPGEFYEISKDPKYFNSKALEEKLDDFFDRSNMTQSSLEGLYCSLSDFKLITGNPYLMAGNHSHRHYVLSTLTKEEQAAEITACQSFLSSHFPAGKISSVFSMPFGGYHTFNEDTLGCLRDAGFRGTVISEPLAYYTAEPLAENHDGFFLYKRFLPKN